MYNSRIVKFALTSLTTAALSVVMLGLAPGQADSPNRVPLVHDWTHNHLVFSKPGTLQEALQLQQEPRYWHQLNWRQGSRQMQDAPEAAVSTPVRNIGDPLHRDWSNVMGGAAGVGTAGVYPAKFSFNINSASCANDFVVFTAGSPGAAGSGALATRDGTFTNAPTAGQTATITGITGTSIVVTASATLNTGLNFLISGTTVTATNMAAAIARNGGTVGVTATNPSAGVVRVTAITQGTGANSIALAETLGYFTWAGTTLAGGTGTAGQPTIFAMGNLYSGCVAPYPSTFWSYNTGAGASTVTSPVLSLYGDQVAFVQSTNNIASLVLLKWSSNASDGTLGAPTALTAVAASAYRTCTAPCMTAIPFYGSPNDTNSSPFYDYSLDVAYVGDDSGSLHKFANLFKGSAAPAEVGAPFAVISSGNVLSSPVLDTGLATPLVFVGSKRGTSTGGQLHSVIASTGAGLNSSMVLAVNSSPGVADAPIIDCVTHFAYVFIGDDAANTGHGVIYQLATNASLSSQTAPHKATLGSGAAATHIYPGSFDSTYYSGTGITGSLYVCGYHTTGTAPRLYRVDMNATFGTTVVRGPTPSTAAGTCSPISEVKNGTSDFLFLSITAGGSGTGCTGACVFSFQVAGLTDAQWGTVAATAGLSARGGTGGIVIDNVGLTSPSGTSQIYFAQLTSPGNVVQASQALLQ